MSKKLNQKSMKFTVIGAGHGGKAMAADLAIMGAQVNLYNRTWMNIEPIKERGGISLIKLLNGGKDRFGKLALVTDDIAEAIRGVQVIMVVIPALGHAWIASQLAPHLEDGQIVVLNPGRTFGAIEFRRMLDKHHCQAKVIVAEAQTFIYASRSDGPAQSRIFRTKEAVPLAAYPATDTKAVLDAINPYYPQFINGKTVLHTGLNNIGAIFHPTIMVHNIGWVESVSGDFQFYLDGVTPAVARIMEATDRERVRIGQALEIEVLTALDWLKLAYEATGANLFEAIHNQPGYRGIKAPTTINHRYINEDIPMSLVPMASMGKACGFRVRGMESIIRLACIARQTDYWKIGRTVENLGLAGMSKEEMLAMVMGDTPEIAMAV